jgi:hypothetical protein
MPGADAVERNAEFHVKKRVGIAGALHDLQAYQVACTRHL